MTRVQWPGKKPAKPPGWEFADLIIEGNNFCTILKLKNIQIDFLVLEDGSRYLKAEKLTKMTIALDPLGIVPTEAIVTAHRAFPEVVCFFAMFSGSFIAVYDSEQDPEMELFWNIAPLTFGTLPVLLMTADPPKTASALEVMATGSLRRRAGLRYRLSSCCMVTRACSPTLDRFKSKDYG
jgi:hypothetical protein